MLALISALFYRTRAVPVGQKIAVFPAFGSKMPTVLSPLARYAARCGFDIPKLIFSLWMVFGSFCALLLAWVLGLDHPQWAAITVFVTIQPSRGQTIEKNIYRLVGTLIGSLVGYVLLITARDNLPIIVLGLAVWSGICLFVGTLQRVYRSYGTVLAGYSAIIVAMNNTGPAEMVTWVALDRVITILIGILFGVTVGYLIAPKINRQEYTQRTRRILAEIISRSAQNLAQAPQSRGAQDYPALTSAAQLCSQFNALSSVRSGRSHQTGPLQDLMICATNVLLCTHRCAADPDLAKAMQSLAADLHSQSDYSGLQRKITKLLPLCQDPKLEECLLMLSLALPDDLGADRGIDLSRNEVENWQYDWHTASQSGLRIFIVITGIGAAWAISGDSVVQIALISSAIVISLASSGVTPARAMKDTILGQVIAALSALFCELVLWNLGLGGFAQVLAMIPSLLVYALLRGHTKTTLSATDYAITLLVLLTPTYSAYIYNDLAVAKAIMAISGGVIGYFAFRYLFTINATKRRKTLWRMVKAELQAIAISQPNVRASHNTWRLRFIARFLRLVDWTLYETKAEPQALTLRKAILTLALGDLIFSLGKALRQADLPSRLKRPIEASLHRLSITEHATVELRRNLQILEQKLASQTTPLPGPELQELLEICREVLQRLANLRQAD